jgi:hypothetical protein
MKKNGNQIMLAGLLITIITVLFFFCPNETTFINKFVITVYKTHPFNFAPIIGLTIMVIGIFLLRDSQEKENLTRNQIRISPVFKLKFNNFKLSFNFLTRNTILNYKLYSFILLILKL